MRKKLLYLLLVLVWTGIIVYGCREAGEPAIRQDVRITEAEETSGQLKASETEGTDSSPLKKESETEKKTKKGAEATISDQKETASGSKPIKKNAVAQTDSVTGTEPSSKAADLPESSSANHKPVPAPGGSGGSGNSGGPGDSGSQESSGSSDDGDNEVEFETTGSSVEEESSGQEPPDESESSGSSHEDPPSPSGHVPAHPDESDEWTGYY